MTDAPKTEPAGKLSRWHIWLIFAGVFLTWPITPFAIPIVSGRTGPESLRQFGDLYGAVNALFSGLAFAGLIIALLIQKQELELQRKELAMTREELAGSKEQMRRQGDTLAKQSFENTFFQMLTLHHEIIARLTHFRNTGLTGRLALVEVYNHYSRQRPPQVTDITELQKTFAALPSIGRTYNRTVSEEHCTIDLLH